MSHDQPDLNALKLAELQSIFTQKSLEKPEMMARYKKRMAYVNELEEKHGRSTMEQYRLFHVITGSTPIDEATSITKFDLPEGEMEHFIRELY